MSKGVPSKPKRSTLTRGGKVAKPSLPQPATRFPAQNTQHTGLNKVARKRERHDTWIKRLDELAKSKAQKEKQAKANPLSCFDALNEQLDKINVQPVVEKRPLNPHLKRVVTDRGRKNALKQEQLQFAQVMTHPEFQANPLSAIGRHLSNVMDQVLAQQDIRQ